MRACAIADVVSEAIARIEPIVIAHEAIARDLGDDRGGGDGDRELVAANEGLVGDVEAVEGDSVNEDEIRTRVEAFDGLSHGAFGGPPDVGAINLARVHDSEGDGASRLVNRVEELLAAVG